MDQVKTGERGWNCFCRKEGSMVRPELNQAFWHFEIAPVRAYMFRSDTFLED
jgi:hypothetical protein